MEWGEIASSGINELELIVSKNMFRIYVLTGHSGGSAGKLGSPGIPVVGHEVL
jgi:hypothetical protein